MIVIGIIRLVGCEVTVNKIHWNQISGGRYIVWYSSPVTGLEWPRGFQEVKVPRFHDNSTGWW